MAIERLGHYRLLEQIGAGGMGEVYRARDERLDRDVAIKILPFSIRDNLPARSRLLEEARSASQLNHSHICTIYEVNEEGGVAFIAMEYVAGRSLSAIIPPDGLPTEQVIRYGTQIADALAHAHQRRIVHRDLKPANVTVTPDGNAKVLDFGLATRLRAEELEGVTLSRVNLADSEPLAGTLPYMPPEQLRGEAADTRSDIWALGVLLYETASGHRPFSGRSGFELTSAILRDPLPPLPDYVSTGLFAVIRKCMMKDSAARYQSAAEVRSALETLIVARNGETTEAEILREGPPAMRLRLRRSLALPALLLIGALIAGGIYLGRHQWGIFSGGSGSNPPPRVLPLTSDPGAEYDPSFSPDGKQVAFVKWDGNASRTGDIYVKLIGGDQPLRLTHGSGWACCSSWSPDGRYVAYGRCDGDQRGLYLVPALGGPERKLPGLACWGTSWSPEGGVIAVTQQDPPDSPWAVFLLGVHDLQLHRLTSAPAGFVGDRHPVFSPDGKTVAFVRASSPWVMDIYLMSVAGGEPRRLTFDSKGIRSLSWAADGRSLVFSSSRPGGGTLWRVSVAGGAPELLPLGGAVAEGLSISRQGNRLAYTQGFLHPNIWQMELDSLRSAGAPSPLIASSRGQGGPQFSPDGKRVSFSSGRSGDSEIWISDADGSNLVQLTSLGVLSGTPRWSPDGKFIAFDSRPAGHSQIFVISAGGGAPRLMTSGEFENSVPSWSRDGEWIYFTSNRSGRWNLWKIAIDGRESIQVTSQGGFAAFESLDGRELFYVKDNDRGIWKRSVQTGEETRISEVAVNWGQWAVSSNGIYYVDTTGPKPTIEFYNFADHKVSRIATLAKPLPPGEPGFAVSPDGRRILYLQVESETDIMLVENFH